MATPLKGALTSVEPTVHILSLPEPTSPSDAHIPCTSAIYPRSSWSPATLPDSPSSGFLQRYGFLRTWQVARVSEAYAMPVSRLVVYTHKDTGWTPSISASGGPVSFSTLVRFPSPVLHQEQVTDCGAAELTQVPQVPQGPPRGIVTALTKSVLFSDFN